MESVETYVQQYVKEKRRKEVKEIDEAGSRFGSYDELSLLHPTRQCLPLKLEPK